LFTDTRQGVHPEALVPGKSQKSMTRTNDNDGAA
jgi:hypothetical protein